MEIKRNRKRIFRILIVIGLTLATALMFFMFKPVSLHYVESDLFTETDIKGAMECVKADFQSLEGCKLLSLHYNGDINSLREMMYQKVLGHQYDECIVIDSAFLSPLSGRRAWDHLVYTWSWILGRNAGGEWVVISRGYA